MAIAVLLVAPEPGATVLAQTLRHQLEAIVEVASSGRDSLTSLRREQFDLVVLEENLAMAEPEATQAIYAAAGATAIVEVNFGICNLDRVVRQVRAALARRAADEAKARKAASVTLHNELNASLTGLLLESQLALRQAGPELTPAIQHLISLASDMRAQLRN